MKSNFSVNKYSNSTVYALVAAVVVLSALVLFMNQRITNIYQHLDTQAKMIRDVVEENQFLVDDNHSQSEAIFRLETEVYCLKQGEVCDGE